MDLSSLRVLVTGSGVGIGAAIASRFGACGARVGVHYNSNQEKAEALCAAINKTGEARSFQCDLHNFEATERLVDEFIAKFGGIDVLVNNAGACYEYRHFTEVSQEALRRTYELNITAPFQLSRKAFLIMRDQGTGGRVINITSGSAKFGGGEYNMHYAASKAALDTVTLGMSRAGAKDNILFNSIRCGIINTDMRYKVDGYSEEKYQKRIAMTPLGRAGTPDEVARLVLFLASEGGDYITGQTITIAGGD